MCAPKGIGPLAPGIFLLQKGNFCGCRDGAKGADHGPPAAGGCVCAGGAGSGGHAPAVAVLLRARHKFERNKGRRSGAPCFWFRYGVRYEPPRMSLLPNVAGQSVCTAGGGTEPPVWKDCRKASIAGQSAASRTSFQTAAPYVFVATA